MTMRQAVKKLILSLVHPFWRRIWCRIEYRIAPIEERIAPLEARVAGIEGVWGTQVSALLKAMSGSPMAHEPAALRQQTDGPGAVYLGQRRVLCRLHLRERLRPDVIYMVDGRDLTFVPRLIMDGIYQPDGTHFVARLINETSHCIDVGANFGYFTCLLGRMAWQGQVIGIEPDPNVAALLQQTITINWIDRAARALNNAVADKRGKVRLRRREGYSANTSIVNDQNASFGDKHEVFEVETIPVDSLLPQLGGRVDFLKVDVEGAEPLVLRGARETIARNPQIAILMEWSPAQLCAGGFDPSSFTDELSALSLVPARLNPDGDTVPITWADVRAMGYGDIVMRRRQS